VTLFIAYATAPATQETSHWLNDALGELALALVVALAFGALGGLVIAVAARRGWTYGTSVEIAITALVLGAFLGAQAIGGNAFVAVFVGGLIFGLVTRGQLAAPVEFVEGFGTFLSVLVWGGFGAILVTETLGSDMLGRPIGFAVLALTIGRMLPVALALLGSRLRWDTTLLMGWFGPRGLASVVFVLLAAQEFEHAGRSTETLIAVATWTILLSVIAHGLSAEPLARLYGRRLAAAHRDHPELADLPELREPRSIFRTREGGRGTRHADRDPLDQT
jgi:NhaP-type Na+/H+ or K+/H+ antiporter